MKDNKIYQIKFQNILIYLLQKQVQVFFVYCCNYDDYFLKIGDEFQLEPAINLFLSYDQQEELNPKRYQLTNELKHALFLEIRTMNLRRDWNSSQPHSNVRNLNIFIYWFIDLLII